MAYCKQQLRDKTKSEATIQAWSSDRALIPDTLARLTGARYCYGFSVRVATPIVDADQCSGLLRVLFLRSAS